MFMNISVLKLVPRLLVTRMILNIVMKSLSIEDDGPLKGTKKQT